MYSGSVRDMALFTCKINVFSSRISVPLFSPPPVSILSASSYSPYSSVFPVFFRMVAMPSSLLAVGGMRMFLKSWLVN